MNEWMNVLIVKEEHMLNFRIVHNQTIKDKI